MTPTETILGAAPSTVTDGQGRRITLRRLNALDKLRLFKAAGPVLAQNQPWLGMAVLACSVAAIDDVPVPAPGTEAQIEAIIARLGDVGIEAIATALSEEPTPDGPEAIATAGN